MRTYIKNQGSRFAEMQEVLDISEKVTCADKHTHAGGPVILSDGKTAYVLDNDIHSIAFGATGSKKTRLYVCALIAFNAKHGESLIINDPKGELYKKFKAFLDDLGYSVYVLNFRNPRYGSRWSPYSIPCKLYKEGNVDKSDTYLRDIGDCVYSDLTIKAKDVFWPNTAKDYFTGLCQLIRNETNGEGLTMEALKFTSAVGNGRAGSESYLKEYLAGADALSTMSMNLNETVNTAADTRGGIISTFAQPLNLYCQEGLRDMMCESDIDITELGRRKTAVFIISPAERSAYNPIIAAFVKQSYSALIDLVASEQQDGRLPVRVNYILDEFSNLPAIPDMNNMITMARSSNIRFNLVVQSIDQLFNAYSPEEARNIINNCEAWFVLRSKDTHLHRIVSEMCGTRMGEYAHDESPLITSRTIQKLSKERGEVLLMVSGMDPFITTLPDIDAYPFGLPAASEITFPPRPVKEREVFDIRNIVRERKKEKMERMLADPSEGPVLPPVFAGCIPEKQETQPFDIDGLISRIDAKIAALEKEESQAAKENSDNINACPDNNESGGS